MMLSEVVVLLAVASAFATPFVHAWLQHRRDVRMRPPPDTRCTARWVAGLVSSDIAPGARCTLTRGHVGEHKPGKGSGGT